MDFEEFEEEEWEDEDEFEGEEEEWEYDAETQDFVDLVHGAAQSLQPRPPMRPNVREGGAKAALLDFMNSQTTERGHEIAWNARHSRPFLALARARTLMHPLGKPLLLKLIEWGVNVNSTPRLYVLEELSSDAELLLAVVKSDTFKPNLHIRGYRQIEYIFYLERDHVIESSAEEKRLYGYAHRLYEWIEKYDSHLNTNLTVGDIRYRWALTSMFHALDPPSTNPKPTQPPVRVLRGTGGEDILSELAKMFKGVR